MDFSRLSASSPAYASPPPQRVARTSSASPGPAAALWFDADTLEPQPRRLSSSAGVRAHSQPPRFWDSEGGGRAPDALRAARSRSGGARGGGEARRRRAARGAEPFRHGAPRRAQSAAPSAQRIRGRGTMSTVSSQMR